MSEEKDFEAIGRYHVYSEELRKLIEMRQSLTSRLISSIENLKHEGNYASTSVHGFDSEKAKNLLNEMISVSSCIEEIIDKVNNCAASAGREKIRMSVGKRA